MKSLSAELFQLVIESLGNMLEAMLHVRTS